MTMQYMHFLIERRASLHSLKIRMNITYTCSLLSAFRHNWSVNNENFFKTGCVTYKHKHLHTKCNTTKGIGRK